MPRISIYGFCNMGFISNCQITEVLGQKDPRWVWHIRFYSYDALFISLVDEWKMLERCFTSRSFGSLYSCQSLIEFEITRHKVKMDKIISVYAIWNRAPVSYANMIVIQKWALLTRTIKGCLIQYIGFCV